MAAVNNFGSKGVKRSFLNKIEMFKELPDIITCRQKFG